MSESDFLAYLIGALVICYFAGYTWGKYVRIINELGRSV